MSETNVNIAPAIFQHRSLLYVAFKCWTGTATLKEADLEIMGSQNLDSEYFKKGAVKLVPKSSLAPFEKRQSKLASQLDNLSHQMKIFKARSVQDDDLPEVRRLLLDCQQDLDALRDTYVGQYAEERAARLHNFDRTHPEFAGRLDPYFPATEKIGDKFGVQWVFAEVRDVERFKQIQQEETENFRGHMRSYVHEMAREFRKKSVEAALAFRRGMDQAKNRVNSRVVDSFKNFLERFEREDVLGDRKMQEMLANIRTRVFDIQSWDVQGDKEAMAAIRGYLDEVVQMGMEEGAAADVADSFVRHVGSTDSVVEFSGPDLADTPPVDHQVQNVEIGPPESPVGPVAMNQ